MKPLHRNDPAFKNIPSDLWARSRDDRWPHAASPIETPSESSERVRLFLLRKCKETPRAAEQDAGETEDRNGSMKCKLDKVIDRCAFSVYKFLVKLEDTVKPKSTSNDK